jgi:NOL1/NOP2/sun family putative RNA methylase
MATPDLPLPFLARMRLLLGSEFDAFLETYKQPPSAGLRVNTLKITPQAFQSIFPNPLTPVPWCPSGFLIEKDAQPPPGRHPYHAAGLYYLQDPSAMAVAELLNPQPGDLTLDLAAAPGGKSTHLASLMAGEGVLVVNETHPRRVWELAENLERWGVQNAAILNETPKRLAQAFGDVFDKVLLDAPCSGEGMFRKSEMARQEWSLQHVASCALRQNDILRQAARLVRPGGLLAYSTCTFAPEENEAVIAGFLKEHPTFELAQTKALSGATPGRPEWVDFGKPQMSETRYTAPLQAAVRLWPHYATGEGHFVALLRRSGSDRRTPLAIKHKRLAPVQAVRLFKAFCSEHLQVEWEANRLAQVGSYLYWIPPGMPELTNLKTIHPGLWLGAVKPGRFEPSHALALALQDDQARQVVRLDIDDAFSYLRGGTLERSGPDGWVQVTLTGFPLGWGKRVKGVIKNYYPKGLRWP